MKFKCHFSSEKSHVFIRAWWSILFSSCMWKRKALFYDKVHFSLKLMLAAFWFLCAYEWTLYLKCMHLKCILDLVCFEPHYWTEGGSYSHSDAPLESGRGQQHPFQRQIMCCMAITHLEEVDRVSADGCGAVWVQTRFLIWMPQGCTEQI